ncbi:hypothetical protein MCOR27_009231, partial [Pyricularia oryzae]
MLLGNVGNVVTTVVGLLATTGVSQAQAVCGDGLVSGNEECDMGAQNGQPGVICDTQCLCVRGLQNVERGNQYCRPMVDVTFRKADVLIVTDTPPGQATEALGEVKAARAWNYS